MEDEWLEFLRVELGGLTPLDAQWTICRVPVKFRIMIRQEYGAHIIKVEQDNNMARPDIINVERDNYMVRPLMNFDAYSPHIISIGPLHHGTQSCTAMEEHKMKYLLFFLERNPDPEATLDACANAMDDLVGRVRDCYAEPIDFVDDYLARMMLLDGCFIIELLQRYHSYTNEPGWEWNDPVFTTSWMLSSLRRDLALLENQIPFFVLQSLFELTVARNGFPMQSRSLKKLAFQFFRSDLRLDEAACENNGGRHLLDLIYKSYLASLPTVPVRGKWKFIHSATTLEKASIHFKKNRTGNLFHLQFDKQKGHFKIPILRVNYLTESLFRNLMVYEQCFYRCKQYVTSYMVLMDRLIDSTADVELLECQGIIENELGSREEVSTLFNNICKEVIVDDFYYEGLCDQVNEYYRMWCHKYQGIAKRDICPNPCRWISFFAALWLLLIATLQTAYAVAAYHFPKKS